MKTVPPAIFFGTSDFAVHVLKELAHMGIIPLLVVTNLDRPQGRGLERTESPVSLWCNQSDIPTFKPARLEAESLNNKLNAVLHTSSPHYFLVAAYGGILPKSVLDIPKRGSLNIHPSLLPRYRGASPIHAALLHGDTETGVTIMLMDEKIDHGPILAAERVALELVPPPRRALEAKLGRLGGALAARTIPDWLEGKITPTLQDESQASYTKMIHKHDGLIALDGDSQKNFRAYLAYDGWPGSFFQIDRGGKPFRVKIIEASLTNGKFNIGRVRPEGKSDMSWNDYVRGYMSPITPKSSQKT